MQLPIALNTCVRNGSIRRPIAVGWLSKKLGGASLRNSTSYAVKPVAIVWYARSSTLAAGDAADSIPSGTPAFIELSTATGQQFCVSQPHLDDTSEAALGSRPVHGDAELVQEVAAKSRRLQKRQRPSGSKFLVRALESAGIHHALPAKYEGKIDFSHVSPWAKCVPSGRAVLKHFRTRPQRPQASLGLEAEHTYNGFVSLQTILAHYIHWMSVAQGHSESVRIGNDDDVAAGFETQMSRYELELLKGKACTVQDVAEWATILCMADSFEAACALARSERRIPAFVLLMLLRRPRIGMAAFRILLHHSWRVAFDPHFINATGTDLASSDENERISSVDHELTELPALSEPTFMVLIIRLLRHARVVWPESIVSVGDLVIQAFDTLYIQKRMPDNAHSVRLTRLFNRLLSLFSQPSTVGPFKYTDVLERAQFNIIAFMAQHAKYIGINREGYRAIVRTQLAQRKTEQERDWASLKCRSWPPWKIDKTRLDSEKGRFYGTSRAGESIMQMHEAGYPSLYWDKVAAIYAGWDTDGTPTYQTRVSLPPAPIGTRLPSTELVGRVNMEEELWVARIRSTRTVHESWVVFLACEESLKMPPSRVYHAVMEKLLADEERQWLEDHPSLHPRNTKKVLPGDGPEVFSPPISPVEAIYLPSQPPNSAAFFERMIAKDIRVSDDTLAMLVSRARSLRQGIRYLQQRTASNICLIHGSDARNEEIMAVPPKVFTALISLLCQSWSNRRLRRFMKQSSRSPLQHAIWLLSIRRPHFRSPYVALLRSLAYNRFDPKEMQNAKVPELAFFGTTRQVFGIMQNLKLDIDESCLHYSAVTVERAIQSFANRTDDAHTLREFKRAVNFVTRLAMDLTEVSIGAELDVTTAQNDLPLLNHVPNPATLHAYVRMLGHAGSYKRLKQLALWMSQRQSTLQSMVDAVANGPRQMRHTLTAFRVFLDRSWEQHYGDESGVYVLRPAKADDETVDAIRELIEGMKGWGGWPNDEEVREYCTVLYDSKRMGWEARQARQ